MSRRIDDDESNAQKEVAGIRRELRDISIKWEKSTLPAFVYQEDVDELKAFAAKLNDVTADFESKFIEYQKLKQLREANERVESFKINADAAERLNQVFNELSQLDGSYEIGYDYNEDGYDCLGSMNQTLSVTKLVDNMKEFIRLAESNTIN